MFEVAHFKGRLCEVGSAGQFGKVPQEVGNVDARDSLRGEIEATAFVRWWDCPSELYG